ncbi:MAG: cytochrome c-type biogenesis protein CcmH [Gammaproteobacteria bacterium]|nr:cytochrome c-type biogenesis protein CcmH [Gammaproteobacteria bacterium]
MMRQFIVFTLMCAVLVPAFAGIEIHQFKTPELEARYKHLTSTLRCLVCQNENLADSNAELAKQLREQIYTMLNDGSSDKEIVDYMVSRYGNFVLYSPPLIPTTYLLWIGPFVLLIFGIIIMQIAIRRNRMQKQRIDDKDYNKARSLLADEESKS